MRSRLLILAAALSMSACSSDPTVAPCCVHASPAPDIRAAAVRAFIVAAGAFSGQTDAVQRATCAPAKTAAQVKSCWMLRAEIERTFNTTVRAIVFPIDVVPTIRSLLIADTRLEAAMAGLGAAPDPAADRTDQNIYASATADLISVVESVNVALGLTLANKNTPAPVLGCASPINVCYLPVPTP
jgi:hypothetical protein